MRKLYPLLLLPFLALNRAAAADRPGPVETVAAFHAALAAGDRDAAARLLSADVVIYEQGSVESSRQEYASEHLGADIEFSRATKRTVVKQAHGGSGATAWVVTEAETRGSFHGKPVAHRSLETMLLSRTGEGWRIVHIHWSSAALPPPAP